MANKSFSVEYIIRAREQYAKVAEKVKRATLKMREAIKKTARAFVNSGKQIRNAGLAMSVAVTVPMAFIARSFKNAARDAQETRSKFATVFKAMGPQAEAAADQLAGAYGLAGTKARELIGDTGDILTGFGFTQKSALDLSTEMNALAVDLASFTNFEGGAEGASKALTKAMLGEAESVKALGIVIRQDTPEYKKMVANFQRTEKVTLVQAKALAALKIATEQSKNAVGDFARTQHELANQERITASRITDLKESFGDILLPVALKITQALRGVVVWITALSPAIKKGILIFAGILAVLGPIIAALGSFLILLPMIKAGLLALGVTAMPALGMLLGVAVLVAAAAFLIIKNWDRVKAFFGGFSTAISTTLGPTIDRLVGKFREAAAVVLQLFGADSDAARSLAEFGNLGELIGTIIGKALDLLIRGLSGVGSALGQLVAAVVSLDFSQFDLEAIKAEFAGSGTPLALPPPSRVDVGVSVGLDKGLTQTQGPQISGTNGGRSDVGVVTP